MIPINDYQKKIYEILKESNYKVFDEVPIDEELPLIVIGDYTLQEGDTKNCSYIFNQKIDIYSEYEGKKEINEMLSVVLDRLKSLINTNITDMYYIDYVKLLEANISRQEDNIYVANINMQIDIEEVI